MRSCSVYNKYKYKLTTKFGKSQAAAWRPRHSPSRPRQHRPSSALPHRSIPPMAALRALLRRPIPFSPPPCLGLPGFLYISSSHLLLACAPYCDCLCHLLSFFCVLNLRLGVCVLGLLGGLGGWARSYVAAGEVVASSEAAFLPAGSDFDGIEREFDAVKRRFLAIPDALKDMPKMNPRGKLECC